MAEAVEIGKLIWLKRSSNYASLLSLVLYLPFGVVLGVLRLFVFLHASLLWFILPRRFPFKRLILRAMLTITGLPISVQGELSTDTRKKVLIANHITNLDPFIIALLNPSILTFETPTCVYPKGNLQTYEIPADKDHSDVVLTVKKKVEENDDPLLFFPERLKTNGKASLLKFSLLPFETDYPIQPVTIQATRYLLDINVSTYSSTAYEDLLLCFLSPLTLFTIKYLPVTEQKKEESKEEFAARVQANMAKSLGISASQYTHHDVREYTKNLNVQEEVRVPVVKKEPPKVKDPSPDSRPTLAFPDSSTVDTELEKMLKQVQDVLPDIPSHCILSDLRKTKDVDETITNILEGRVPTSSSADVPAKDLISLSQGLSFKANSFESSAKARELSFAERKQAMLEAARLMYRIKKNL